MEKSSSSGEVREKAAGALWILENRDQAKNRPKSAKRGLYMQQLVKDLVRASVANAV